MALARHVSTADGLVKVAGPAPLSTAVAALLRQVTLSGEPPAPLEVTITPDSRTADGTADGRLIWSIALPSHAPVSTVLGQIVGTLTTTLTQQLFIHAGAVAFHGRAMVVVGHSGAGKTSTVAALVRRGAAYLSDEVALLNPSTRTVAPFLLPMAVKPWTREAAGALPRGRRIAREAGTELWLPDHVGGPAAVDSFVLLRGDEPGPRLSPISPAQMLLAISDHASSFKQQHRVRESFSGFVRLLRTARCAALRGSRPAAHSDLLVEFAAQTG